MPMIEPLAATRNACKLCAPLGACMALRGVEGAAPFLHGSQGCATYIRRYLISHFREPVDIAVSGFSEATTVFGGRDNLHSGLKNVARQYHPELIGIATTCLPETIGEDVGFLLHEFDHGGDSTLHLVHVSTPSYRGTHVDGFHATIRALVEQLADGGAAERACQRVPRHGVARRLALSERGVRRFRTGGHAAAGLFGDAGRAAARRIPEDPRRRDARGESPRHGTRAHESGTGPHAGRVGDGGGVSRKPIRCAAPQARLAGRGARKRPLLRRAVGIERPADSREARQGTGPAGGFLRGRA